MSAAHIQLVVDLELRSEPIAGFVGAGDAAPRSFRGWSELTALIESHRAANDAFDAGLTIDVMASER